MVEALRPTRGGFLRLFGCGWFIRELLPGNGPNGSPRIDPDTGAPQADVFHYYKKALSHATALDRATREEERRARHGKRSIRPEEIERLTERYMASLPYKSTGCRYHSFAVNYLRAGGDTFTLQRILGHSSLTMTRHCAELSHADVEAKQKTFSPAEKLGLRV